MIDITDRVKNKSLQSKIVTAEEAAALLPGAARGARTVLISFGAADRPGVEAFAPSAGGLPLAAVILLSSLRSVRHKRSSFLRDLLYFIRYPRKMQ